MFFGNFLYKSAAFEARIDGCNGLDATGSEFNGNVTRSTEQVQCLKAVKVQLVV